MTRAESIGGISALVALLVLACAMNNRSDDSINPKTPGSIGQIANNPNVKVGKLYTDGISRNASSAARITPKDSSIDITGDLNVTGTISGNGVEKPKAHIISVAKTGGDYTSIRAAINAASAGDTIYITPGVYAEQITLKDGVNLVGTVRPSLDASYNITGGAIIRKNQGSDQGVVQGGAVTCTLENLAIENIKNTYWSCALLMSNGAVNVRNCILKSAHADTVILQAGNHIINDCWIIGGYDIVSTYCNVYIKDSSFVSTDASALADIWISGSPNVHVIDNHFRSSPNSSMAVVRFASSGATLYFVQNSLASTYSNIFNRGSYTVTIDAAGNNGGGVYASSFDQMKTTPLKTESLVDNVPALYAGRGLDNPPMTEFTSDDIYFKRRGANTNASGNLLKIEKQWGGKTTSDIANNLYLLMTYDTGSGEYDVKPAGNFIKAEYYDSGLRTKFQVDKDGNLTNAGYVDSASYVDGATGFKVNGTTAIDANRNFNGGNATLSGYVDSASYVDGAAGFKVNGTAGVTQSLTVVTDICDDTINGGFRKRTSSLTITGGIITSVQDNGWDEEPLVECPY
jgi:hypothetical protein